MAMIVGGSFFAGMVFLFAFPMVSGVVFYPITSDHFNFVLTNTTSSNNVDDPQFSTTVRTVQEVILNSDKWYGKTITVQGNYSDHFPFPTPKCAVYPSNNPIVKDDSMYVNDISLNTANFIQYTGTYSGQSLPIHVENTANSTNLKPLLANGQLITLKGILEKSYTGTPCGDQSHLYKTAFLLVQPGDVGIHIAIPVSGNQTLSFFKTFNLIH